MAAVLAAARGARESAGNGDALRARREHRTRESSDLSVGERQRVEILKALYRGARVLILDEPTAVLTPQESRDLFATLRQLVTEGLSIIFISHKLDEVLAVSDRIAVLRNGRLVALRDARGATKAELAELMVGRAVVMPTRERRARGSAGRSRCAACTRAMRTAACSSTASISTVAAGEIVAIAGVAGNGQQALAGSAVGNARAGTRNGDARRHGACREAARVDRRAGRANSGGSARGRRDRRSRRLGKRDLGAAAHAGLHARRVSCAAPRAARTRDEIVRRFDVRLSGIDVPARSLSGGNMQKLILGRALTRRRGRDAGVHPGRPADMGARHRRARLRARNACSMRPARAPRCC